MVMLFIGVSKTGKRVAKTRRGRTLSVNHGRWRRDMLWCPFLARSRESTAKNGSQRRFFPIYFAYSCPFWAESWAFCFAYAVFT